jgi:hypothetical protein
MAVDVQIKSNAKEISQKFKKFQSVLPRIIDKGLKQAGFQLLDIIRTKHKKVLILEIDLLHHTHKVI